MDKLYYPGIVEKGEDGYYVSFPDLPGLVSAGNDMQALASNAEAALKLHVSGMLEDGEALPLPANPLGVESDPDVTEIARLMVGVDSEQAKVRVNVMFDRALLAAIDAATGNRSRFLAEAARGKLLELGSATY
jgi:predicted RNase H-like HicB family nuclease